MLTTLYLQRLGWYGSIASNAAELNLKWLRLLAAPRKPTHHDISQTCDVCETDTTIGPRSQGVCRKLSQCPLAVEAIAEGKMPIVCAYDWFSYLVCCPVDVTAQIQPGPTPRASVRTQKSSSQSQEKRTTATPIVGTTETDSTPQDKARKKCEEYAMLVWSRVKSPVLLLDDEDYGYYKVSECGIPEAHVLVYGGIKAHPKEFPHMAAVGFGTKDQISWWCGGSLISERFVLTAGHCIEDPNPRGKGRARWVRLGDLNLASSEDDARPQDYAVVQRIPHPSYRYPSKYNDVALLRLERDADFSGYVRPACLHTDHGVERALAIATGWGRTSTGPTQDLMKVDLSLLKFRKCQTTFNITLNSALQRTLNDGVLEDSMLCAGELQGGKDTCQGDSGGPLQYLMDTPYCMYSLVGITSFGMECAAAESPAIYTRVSHFVPWIVSVVWP
uniref:Peptidase S1 domain-containing protein n=1 Tax=Timema shepardi TaxID=629360 RepID=A0A7R9B5Q6_TIMSH|nr:unnamed protein product [Timema shepardi]